MAHRPDGGYSGSFVYLWINDMSIFSEGRNWVLLSQKRDGSTHWAQSNTGTEIECRRTMERNSAGNAEWVFALAQIMVTSHPKVETVWESALIEKCKEQA
jgi:hypothetical protein